MQTTLDCVPCIINSFIRLLKLGELVIGDKEQAMRKLLRYMSDADYQQSPPDLGREMHRMMREELNDPDPYKGIKNKYNIMMLEMYSEFENIVESAKDPFNMAMRLAVAGNVIDFGPQDQLDIMDTINRVVHSNIDIDDSILLKSELENAKRVLYIGDNCGEIVLDKLFLETIKKPDVYFAVRGGPVLNDATIEDAKMVGIDKIAKIITTGDDAPGVILEDTSEKFKQIFNESDLIIAKGQGNLEGLLGVNKNIYYLLVAKCDLIGRLIGTKRGEFIVKKNPYPIEDEMVI
jgi:damage-control phosphatase, subfamily I